MKNQKHLFQLPEDVHYLNTAYMSPLLKSVEKAGVEALIQKRNPTCIQPKDFFEQAEMLRSTFGKLINCPAQQVAIIPSASYGLMAAVRNLPLDNGKSALVVAEEFPSGYYTIEKWCKTNDKNLIILPAPNSLVDRGKIWNQQILNEITADTAVLLMSSIHWTDGTLFDLKAIGEKCKITNTMFIVDGTQSVGAVPMDVADFEIDALICSGYKWLMGPYSIGLAYYSEYFNQGSPLEETWMNRTNAQNFSGITQYVDEYTLGAGRFNMGEFSNFTLLPMLQSGITQLLDWEVVNIQNYCDTLTRPLVKFLPDNKFWIEEDAFRSKHLFGFRLPDDLSQETLVKKLQNRKIYVSVRGNAIRVSIHLFNTPEDITALIEVLEEEKNATV